MQINHSVNQKNTLYLRSTVGNLSLQTIKNLSKQHALSFQSFCISHIIYSFQTQPTYILTNVINEMCDTPFSCKEVIGFRRQHFLVGEEKEVHHVETYVRKEQASSSSCTFKLYYSQPVTLRARISAKKSNNAAVKTEKGHWTFQWLLQKEFLSFSFSSSLNF